MSTGSVPKQQPEESQQQPCSYQEIFIKSEGSELKENTEVEVLFFDNEDEEVDEEIFFKLDEEVGRGQGGWSRALHHQVGQHLLCGIDKEEEEVYFDDEDKEV